MTHVEYSLAVREFKLFIGNLGRMDSAEKQHLLRSVVSDIENAMDRNFISDQYEKAECQEAICRLNKIAQSHMYRWEPVFEKLLSNKMSDTKLFRELFCKFVQSI